MIVNVKRKEQKPQEAIWEIDDFAKAIIMLPDKDAITAVCVWLPDGEEHWFSIKRRTEDVYIGALVAVPYNNGIYVATIQNIRYDAPYSLAYLEHEGVADIIPYKSQYYFVKAIDQIIGNRRELICKVPFCKNQEAYYTDIAGVKRAAKLKREVRCSFKKNTFYPFVEL